MYAIRSYYDNDRSVGIGTTQGVLILDTYSLKYEKHFTQIEAKYGVLSVSDVFYHNELGWFIATNGSGLFTVYKDGSISQSVITSYSIHYTKLYDRHCAKVKKNTVRFTKARVMPSYFLRRMRSWSSIKRPGRSLERKWSKEPICLVLAPIYPKKIMSNTVKYAQD